MTRSRRRDPSLRPPPSGKGSLAGFPARTLQPDVDLYRVVRKGRNPWWFGGSMEGRFDLPAPKGTCYLASDELAALLETLGPGRAGGGVSADFLAARTLRRLHVPREWTAADLVSRKAAGYGLTAEIGTLVPYDLPQIWAARLHEAGFAGLVHGLRHDPSRSEGIALFGRQGERKRWKRGREQKISQELIEGLRKECGIEVVPVPHSRQLRFVDET